MTVVEGRDVRSRGAGPVASAGWVRSTGRTEGAGDWVPPAGPVHRAVLGTALRRTTAAVLREAGPH